MANVVAYKEYEKARGNAKRLLTQMEENMGFDRAIGLSIYPEENGKVKTSVWINEIGLDSMKLMKLAVVMTYANELMQTFPYNGYTIEDED